MSSPPNPDPHASCTDQAKVIALAPNSLVPVFHAVYPCGLSLILAHPTYTQAELRTAHDDYLKEHTHP